MKKIPNESSTFRLAGQRSITSSLNLRSSDRISQNGRAGNGGKVLLSDILSKKLHKSSVLPETFKDKEKLRSPLVCRENFSGPLNCDQNVNNNGAKDFHLDKCIFDKFKPVGYVADEECVSLCIAGDVQSWDESHSDVSNSKKRAASFDHGSGRLNGKKHVVIVGDDPRPSSSINKAIYHKSERSVPLYNHYANGRGWWDSNMEGVATEEVGSSEVWEGVGSTTLGGLDWH